MESPDGTVHLKNFSLQPAVNEEEGKVSLLPRGLTAPTVSLLLSVLCVSSQLVVLGRHQPDDCRGEQKLHITLLA